MIGILILVATLNIIAAIYQSTGTEPTPLAVANMIGLAILCIVTATTEKK